MTATFVGEVERLTGRTVVAYHSQVVLEPASCFEIFVLDPTQHGLGAPEQAGAPVQAADLHEPGQVGDVDQLPSPGERPAPGGSGGEAAGSHQAGGAVRAAISNAVVRLVSELYGQGRRADPHLHRRRARVLRAGGSADHGRADPRRGRRDRARARAPHAVRRDGPAGVRGGGGLRLLGRHVLAVESQLVFDPDTLFLIFVLGDAARAGAGRRRGRDRRRRPISEYKRCDASYHQAAGRTATRSAPGPVAGDGQSVGRGAALRAASRLIEQARCAFMRPFSGKETNGRSDTPTSRTRRRGTRRDRELFARYHDPRARWTATWSSRASCRWPASSRGLRPERVLRRPLPGRLPGARQRRRPLRHQARHRVLELRRADDPRRDQALLPRPDVVGPRPARPAGARAQGRRAGGEPDGELHRQPTIDEVADEVGARARPSSRPAARSAPIRPTRSRSRAARRRRRHAASVLGCEEAGYAGPSSVSCSTVLRA